MKNQKRTQWRRFRPRSFEISKGILVLRPTIERTGFTRVFLCLICILGLAFIGPAAAHAGGPKVQQQSRARSYAGPGPTYHTPVGGAYHFNAPNVPTTRSALTGKPMGLSTQRGVQALRPNMNQAYQPYRPYQPYVRQLGTPTPARTPLQVERPQSQSFPATAASAKTRAFSPNSSQVRSGPSSAGGGGRHAEIAMGSSQMQSYPSSGGVGGTRPAITMGSSQLGSHQSSVGTENGGAAGSTVSGGIDPTGQFQQNRRIQGSDQWDGSNYQTFRSYRSEWHDRDWWRSHYSRIVFGAGGWYYWKAGYWYPAWGYDPDAHYAYDGPIYAYNDLPPDQVVANAQAALRPQGYYKDDPDGLLGSHTRAAIVNYQRDHRLYETSTIDLPTSQSLGMK
jgi:Putative peptidoglycan binding domain